MIQHGRSWDAARALVLSYPLTVEPVTLDDAERAASIWSPESGLSLGDRLCLALGDRMNSTILTGDRRWGTQRRVRQIR